MNLILYAVPVFLLTAALEAWWSARKRLRLFNSADVTADFALGSLQILFSGIAAGILVGSYQYLYDEYRLFTIPINTGFTPEESSHGVVGWVMWFFLFVGLDFFYYWFHRSGHRINVAWATHAPHHSSEFYNLAVALRQGPVQPIVSRLFYLPLAILGFAPEPFVIMVSLNAIYQFFIHTEVCDRFTGKWAWIEQIFNTPSHHRVHHGCNGQYIDKNHAGVLIIWDKMFGSFVPENPQDRPYYGTIKQVATWNPIQATWQPFVDIAKMGFRSKNPLDWLQIWFRPPEWVPPSVRKDIEINMNVAGRTRYAHLWEEKIAPALPPWKRWYGYINEAAVIVLTVLFLAATLPKISQTGGWFLGSAPYENFLTVSIYTCWLCFSFASVGAWLDGKKWPLWAEPVRWIAVLPVFLG